MQKILKHEYDSAKHVKGQQNIVGLLCFKLSQNILLKFVLFSACLRR